MKFSSFYESMYVSVQSKGSSNWLLKTFGCSFYIKTFANASRFLLQKKLYSYAHSSFAIEYLEKENMDSCCTIRKIIIVHSIHVYFSRKCVRIICLCQYRI